MKPFLGIDLTTDKKNNQVNGDEFLIQTPSLALSKSLKTSTERAEETIENSKLRLPFRIVQLLFGMGALFIVYAILKSDVSIGEAYSYAPWAFWTAGFFALVWVVLYIWSKYKSKSILQTDESLHTLSRLYKVTNAVFKELDVPDDAQNVDVFLFYYKIKNGNMKVLPKNLATHFNREFKIFADDKNIYLATTDGKYAFPLSSIVKIHTVDKNIRISGWNKKQDINSDVYKKYKLSYGENGCFNCKRYHILEINRNGETFGIYFPCYEFPVFEEYIK